MSSNFNRAEDVFRVMETIESAMNPIVAKEGVPLTFEAYAAFAGRWCAEQADPYDAYGVITAIMNHSLKAALRAKAHKPRHLRPL